jgi:hypothetical protein
VFLISPDGRAWWDKTCGVNGHPACTTPGPGFALVPEDFTLPVEEGADPAASPAAAAVPSPTAAADGAGGSAADLRASTLDIDYITSPGDENAPHMALFIVRAGQVAGLGDPNGGPLPASLLTLAAGHVQITRGATGNTCLAVVLPATATATASPSAEAQAAGGGGDAATSPLPAASPSRSPAAATPSAPSLGGSSGAGMAALATSMLVAAVVAAVLTTRG